MKKTQQTIQDKQFGKKIIRKGYIAEKNKYIQFLFFGWLYNCTECGELWGIIKNQEYPKDEYEAIRMKYEKEWKCKETGSMTLSISADNSMCPKCRKLKGLKIVGYPELKDGIVGED